MAAYNLVAPIYEVQILGKDAKSAESLKKVFELVPCDSPMLPGRMDASSRSLRHTSFL